jgi:hypothetical protein
LFRCKSMGVDPMDRLIYVVPRNQNVNEGGRWHTETRWVFQSSIDLFRSIAEDSGDYAGQLGPYWSDDGKEWSETWLSDKPPAVCRVGVLRKSFKEPLWVTGTYAYYVPRDKAGDPAPTAFWKGEKGAHQLAKCVEELALRKAFPRRLHGVYGDDEMQQAERVPALRQPEQAHEAEFTALPAAEPKTLTPEEMDEAKLERRRKSVMASCTEHGIAAETRYAITEALFGAGVRSSNSLDYRQLGELRDELKAFTDAKVTATDEDEFRAYLAYRADLRAEQARA